MAGVVLDKFVVNCAVAIEFGSQHAWLGKREFSRRICGSIRGEDSENELSKILQIVQQLLLVRHIPISIPYQVSGKL